MRKEYNGIILEEGKVIKLKSGEYAEILKVLQTRMIVRLENDEKISCNFEEIDITLNTEKILNAKIAKKKSLENLSCSIKETVDKINKEIKKAIQEGKFEIRIKISQIEENSIATLYSNYGYRVESSNISCYITISW